LLVGGGCYVAASLVAATMARDRLGPNGTQARRGPLLGELASVAAGLADGARYVARRRGPAAALGATGGFSFLFGPLFLMSVLLYRNYFYRSSVSVAEGHFGVLVVLSGIGYACAALITPPVTRRLSKPAWITLLLAISAVVTLVLGETFSQPAYLAIGFCLYLTRQGVAICVVTILQEEVDDAYRGRVFAFYDMMFKRRVRRRGGAQRGRHAGRWPFPPSWSAWWRSDTRSSRPATGWPGGKISPHPAARGRRSPTRRPSQATPE